ncbi:hypothetical protein D3C71_1727740 [compost metagenome]
MSPLTSALSKVSVVPFEFVAASSFFIRSAPSSAKAGLVRVRSAALAIIRRILRVCIIVEFLRENI